MKTKNIFMSFLLTVLFSAQFAFGADAAITRQHTLHLNEFKGKTFLQAMIAEDGIKAQLDSDYLSTYAIPNWKTVETTLNNFDTKISKKVLRSFPNGKADLEALITSLDGTEFIPDQLFSIVKPRIPAKADVYAISQLIAFASGAGTLVILDENNYFYNYGYKSGANPDDVKSGRSFGAGPLHNANDASDVFYLNELEQYLNETQDMKPFYEAMLKIIIKCDVSGLKKLSPLGQTVLTDFVAIYTAESDRHIMVELDPNRHPWENDLAGATFVSAFAVRVGKVMKDGALTEGAAREWWAMSSLNNGRSGIGITRNDRQKLQRLISGYLTVNASEKAEAIKLITGERKDQDMVQALMEFLNDYDTQAEVVHNANAIIRHFSDLMSQTSVEAAAVESHISSLAQ